MRWLALDIGDKRTGVATGDEETGIAAPVRVVEVGLAAGDGAALLEEADRLAREQGANGVVVGLPLNMDGTESARSKAVRAWGAKLETRLGLPVEFGDERLTTDAAHWEMARSGLTRGQKKGRRDALAAAAILRDFLEARRRGERPGARDDQG